MESIDLDKYKEAWKKEPIFEEKNLTKKEITQFIRSSSKSIQSQFKSALILDIVLKSLLSVAVIYLLLFAKGSGLSFTLLTFLIILISGALLQFGTLKKLSLVKFGGSIIKNLQDYLGFYHIEYRKSILINASTATMVFLTGSYFYFIMKYVQVPDLEWDDYTVFGIGSLLSFGISFFAQNHQFRFNIGQLEKLMKEADEGSLKEEHIQNYHSNRKRWIWIFAILGIVGIALLMYLLFT
ncbi:hypothetical protein [uncultured Algoriphagus sp.]|uniref:hypothetical protein n=1 Tax=uncultured Algoriphagus sp. TaxID=417365 RepID=UPI0025876771|nr:hypothetical protein [uncultured Algoriphagus sp.]